MKLALLFGGLSVTACLDEAKPKPLATQRLEVRVLGGLLPAAKVCLDFAVSNGLAEVWAAGNPEVTSFGAKQTGDNLELRDGQLAPDREAVCASGATVATTIACDRDHDVSDAPGVQNELTFWIDEVNRDASGAEHGRTNWIDPCPDGCKIAFDCEGDTTVDIGLTNVDIGLTNAVSSQGFMEPGSIIDDAWCSGKVNSCTDLLHNDAGDARLDTATVAFSCSTPPGAELRMDTLEVICDTARFTLPLSDGPARKTQSGDATLTYATYIGTEAIVPEFPKSYVNHAIRVADLAALGGNCRLRFDATAVTDRDVLEAPADATIYPIFSYDVALTKDGEATCDTVQFSFRDTPGVYRGNVIGMAPLPALCTKVVDGVPSSACE